MTEEKDCCSPKEKRKMCGGGFGGGTYGLAFIGALIYFIQQAETFPQGALGALKALVWPAIIVYKALEFFNL